MEWLLIGMLCGCVFAVGWSFGMKAGFRMGWVNCVDPTEEAKALAAREVSDRVYVEKDGIIYPLPFWVRGGE